MAFHPPTAPEVRALLGLSASDVTALKKLVPVVATSYTVALASSTAIVGGTVNVTATPVGGGWPAGETLSPALGGIQGAFSPQSATSTAGSTAPVSFALTPGAAGTGTVTVTASPSMGTPSGVQITVSAAAAAALPAITNSTSNATFMAGATQGTVAALSAPPSGATRTLLPGDGRLTLNVAQTAIVVGLTASSAGMINATVQDKNTSTGAVSPILSVPVTVTAAQPAPTPTPAPTPVNGATLHSFNLVNWGTASSVGMARQGTMFRQGAVPAGSSVQVQRAGAVVAAQFNERRSWPDGSLAFTVMHIRDTSFAAGVRQSYNLVLVMGTAFTDVAGTAPDQIAAGHAFSMNFGNHTSQNDTATTTVGSGTSTASLAAHMAVATRREVHHVGGVCDGATCWGMAQDATGGAVDAHLKTIWHVDRWKNADGSTYAVEIGCEPAQDWWSELNKTRRNYDASLMDGATTIASYAAVPHMYNSHWLTVQNAGGNNRGRRHWVGGACPTLSYEPDRAYWISTGYVPPLNLATPRNPVPSPGDRAGNAIYQPISNQEHRPAIDGTGPYMGRGCVLGNVDCLAFLSQSPADMAAARINAMAGLHVFYHHRSNRQRTRPGESADIANTPISLIMSGPGTMPAYDFTAQGMPVPVHAYCDSRNAPSDMDSYVSPTGGRIFWDTSYGQTDAAAGFGNSRSDDASHAVNYSYGMALLEGERYHMEATFDLAMNTLHQGVDALHRISAQWFGGSSADATYDAVAQFGGQERSTAFSLMLIGAAVALVPDNHPASPMLKRLNHQQGLWYQDMLPRMTADLAAAGCHPWAENQGDVQTPWQTSFNAMTGYFNWRVTGEAGVKAWAEHMANWSINQARDRIYATRQYRGSNKHSTERQSPTNLYQLAALEIDSPVVSIAAATGLLTCTDYSRSDGAILYPATKNYAASVEPLTTELTLGTPYYTRDTNGLSFRISTSPGGQAVTFGRDYTNIHFLQDTSNAGFNADGPCSTGLNADDYGPMHRAVVVEAMRVGHPQATQALVDRMQTFVSNTPAAQLAGWATWDYAMPGGTPAPVP